MVSNKVVTAAAIVIAVLVAGIYLPFALRPSTSTTSTSASSTTSTPTVSTTTTSTATSITTTMTASSSVTNGSFSYLPAYPVKIDSVDAVTIRNKDGTEYVTFRMRFENAGPVPIYVIGGCGSGLDSSIQTNPVIQKTSGGPICACAQLMLPINQGQNHTSITPGCWSGYSYMLNQPGSVSVDLTLHWSLDVKNFSGTNNSTSILARFTFA